ncbi:MAG: crossover junction endodeoxyribonuclease RuvC [Pseudomonadota bacterium]
MLILGVDPGTVKTGYGIVSNDGSSPVFVAGGVLRTRGKQTHWSKLLTIYSALDEIIKDYRPTEMVVESLFHSVNSQSLIKLGQVRGVILLLGASHGMNIFEYSPREIKQGITGYGHADKAQVMYMIQKILSVSSIESSDQSDALAMATYHAHSHMPQRIVK